MGVLLNLTEEYFKKTKRTEDFTEFDKYLYSVEWVDLGHPKYLFAKTDFKRDKEKLTYCENDALNAIEVYDILENMNPVYKPMTRSTFFWLVENCECTLSYISSFSVEKMTFKKGTTGIDMISPGSCHFYYWFAYECKKELARKVFPLDKYYMSWFSFMPSDFENKDKIKKSGKKLEYILEPENKCFFIKMMKLKK